MLPGTPNQSFTQGVIDELSAFPQKGLFYLGGWGILSAAADWISWSHRPGYQAVDYVLAASLVVGAAAISYFSVTRMVEAPTTLRSAFWFFGTGGALFVPILLALGAVILAEKLKIQWAVFIGILIVLASMLPIAFLPGWPIWQAKALRLISPMEAFRATKGFRWALFFASFVDSYLNRALPKISSTGDFLTAFAIAIGDGLVACLSLIVGVSIGVAAYRRMCTAGVEG